MMIALKSIQPSFTARNHVLLQTRRIAYSKNSSLCLSKSSDSESESDAESSSSPDGDTRKQELLAQIAMLQTQKVRLTDYLDERSAYLTQFAEEANAEFDKVGEDALRELDEAGERVGPEYKLQLIVLSYVEEDESLVDCNSWFNRNPCRRNCRLFHICI